MIAKGSIVFLDTNICIYRTLSLIDNPPIYERDYLDKSIRIIASLTNNNLACQIIVSDITASELANNRILFNEVRKFCFEKLGWKSSYKILSLMKSTEKSITKFIDKKVINQQMISNIKNYHIHMQKVKDFYLKYPDKLKEITSDKIRGLSKKIDINNKIYERPNNLPELNDLKLLCQAIETNSLYQQDVCIFTNDKDFTKFKEEILNEFGINIIVLDDCDSIR